MMNRQQMPTRAPALFLLAGLVAGLCLARAVVAPIGLALVSSLLLALLSLSLSRRRSGLWLLTFLTACILAFWAYGSLRLPAEPDPAELELPVREASLQFVVERVMQAHNPYGKATGLARIVAADPTSRVSEGDRMFFRVELPENKPLEVLRGSELRATGVLEAIPEGVDPESFEGYLKDTGTHYRFGRVHGLELVRPPAPFDRFCQAMNLRFQNFLRLGTADDHSLDGIYIAMLLGHKAELSDAQTDRFRMTGTMHFFAISGLHIGVIATVIAQFLILVRVPRRLAPFLGLPLLYLYVEITGAPPSAVRAFLMATFFWASFAFTRQRSPLAALAASAVFVLIFEPEQLWSLGFQLSYTVVLSILLLGLPLYETASAQLTPFRDLPKANWTAAHHIRAWLQDALLLLFSISFAAWLASAPLSAAFFGYLSPGAVILNMALVNLAALTISAGIISLSVATIGGESIAAFINHAAWVTIHAMDALVAWSAQVPGMILHCSGFPEWIAYTTLAVYFTLIFWIHRARGYGRDILWLLPPTVIVAGLLCGLLWL